MIERSLSPKLKQLAGKFPLVIVTGPRQSGKTTLVRSAFPQKTYVSLEEPDVREFARTDPRGFLETHAKGAILDEIQRVPSLFSYLQTDVDEHPEPGRFILTGSQNFLLLENLSQSLAGRAGLLTLLPLSASELKATRLLPSTLERLLFTGFYPRLYDRKIDPPDWYPSYVQAYIERDIRLLKNIDNLDAFQTFVKLCAARTGQLLNLSSLATDGGITHNTARSWLGILEASFIVFFLRPHHENFNKRLVKMPKLYFYDTGVVCSLLGIRDSKDLEVHPIKGGLFETFVMSELVKNRRNKGLVPDLHFWRDKTGHEIDCVVESKGALVPIEIKSGKTISSDFFKNIRYLKKTAPRRVGKSFLVYGGDQNQKRQDVDVLGWESTGRLP